VVIIESDERIITPMRFRILPYTGVELPDKYNVYNADRDAFSVSQTSKRLFGKKHAVFPFIRFYEWVTDKQTGKKMELSFTPEGFDYMWAASLYEEYNNPDLGLLRSFSMVTDHPPPEVRDAGHNRCPVFLENLLLDDWMTPNGKSLEYLDQLLDAKEPAYYSHALAA
jgi:putative SOS response-associated peptidase YedK